MSLSYLKENSSNHYDGNIHVMVYESDSAVPYHCHEEEEFICITDGVCICKVDSSTYIVKKGECVLIRGRYLHAILPYKNESFRYFSIVFHPLSLFGNDCQKYFTQRYCFKAIFRNDIKNEKQITDCLDDIYPDILDERTADAFLTLTHEKYVLKFKKDLSCYMPCVFIDEPNLAPTPWTPSLDEEFFLHFHYDIKDYLPALLDDTLTEDADMQARIDYRNIISALLIKNFYSKINAWCHMHGVLLTGHADGDDSILTHYQNGHLLQVLRQFDMPGVDAIHRQIFPSSTQKMKLVFDDYIFEKKTAENKFFPRMASSAANQTGKKRSLSESFAVYGSGLTFEQMRYIINFQAVRGINVFNIMNTTYSGYTKILSGLRPFFGEKLPGCTDKSCLNDYIARLSYLLSIGVPDIETALYFPIRDVWADGEQAKLAGESYERIGQSLEDRNINFDIIDDEIILNAPLNSTINAGFSKYRVVVIPQCHFMPSHVLDKLHSFAKNGVHVIWADQFENAILSHSEQKPRFSDHANFKSIRRILENGSLYFIYNEGCEAKTTTIFFSESQPMYELNLTNGEIYSVLNPTVTIHLHSGEGIAYLFTDKILPTQDRKPQITDYQNQLTLKEFDLRIQNEYVLTTEEIAINPSDFRMQKYALTEQPLPVSRSFSGDIFYEAQFEMNKQPSAGYIAIDLGTVCYTCEIFLNGHSLGVLVAPPYRIYADAGLLQKENTLKIRVSNTIANQFVYSKVFDLYDHHSIGTYHFIEKEFEKESCECGLKDVVKIYY